MAAFLPALDRSQKDQPGDTLTPFGGRTSPSLREIFPLDVGRGLIGQPNGFSLVVGQPVLRGSRRESKHPQKTHQANPDGKRGEPTPLRGQRCSFVPRGNTRDDDVNGIVADRCAPLFEKSPSTPNPARIFPANRPRCARADLGWSAALDGKPGRPQGSSRIL